MNSKHTSNETLTYLTIQHNFDGNDSSLLKSCSFSVIVHTALTYSSKYLFGDINYLFFSKHVYHIVLHAMLEQDGVSLTLPHTSHHIQWYNYQYFYQLLNTYLYRHLRLHYIFRKKHSCYICILCHNHVTIVSLKLNLFL